MLAVMARNRFTVRTLVPVLGVAVLVLGAFGVWVFVHERTVRSSERPFQRAERQVREQRGGDWEVRYVEAGSGPAVCGYAAPRNRGDATHEPVAFISRIGRILFADEPLPTEFRALREEFCPAFARSPAAPAYVNPVQAP
ncbi:hypothetical protein [Brevundimonas sp.]|uniref:hypothetical protein n=1 Tax=Brevundimonas sp. TaxID=1871086 RepID=UPI00286A7677|nr:hypothetical protein [Brevundimonas sp.]